MNALAAIIYYAAEILIWMIIIWAVLGWLIAFNVINTRNQFVVSVMRSLDALLTPMLRPIRRVLPVAGGIDFSPLVLLIVIIVIRIFLLQDVLPWLAGSPTYAG